MSHTRCTQLPVHVLVATYDGALYPHTVSSPSDGSDIASAPRIDSSSMPSTESYSDESLGSEKSAEGSDALGSGAGFSSKCNSSVSPDPMPEW